MYSEYFNILLKNSKYIVRHTNIWFIGEWDPGKGANPGGMGGTGSPIYEVGGTNI